MDRSKLSHRRYHEKEVGALIQRATELHEEAMGAPAHSLSLEEVEHIAAELSLPPEHVRAAALEMEERMDAGSSFSLLGRPFVIEYARFIEETMTEEQWEQVVLAIRRFVGSTGRIDTLGGVREWSRSIKDGSSTLEKTQVSIRPDADRLAIQIRKHYGGGAFIVYMMALILSVAVTGITLDGSGFPDDLTNFAIVGGMGLGALAAVRVSLSVWARRHKERLKRLADLVHRTLTATAPQVLANETAPEQIELAEHDEIEHAPAKIRRSVRA